MALEISISLKQIRLPARGAAAGCAAAIARKADAVCWAEKLMESKKIFPLVLGVSPIKTVRAENGWLLFDLSDELYMAAAADAAKQITSIVSDHECYPLHRMRMIARHPSHGCPAEESVQRALLLSFCADEQPTAANRIRAEEALLSMAYGLPQKERMSLLCQCGDVARAAVWLLYDV